MKVSTLEMWACVCSHVYMWCVVVDAVGLSWVVLLIVSLTKAKHTVTVLRGVCVQVKGLYDKLAIC